MVPPVLTFCVFVGSLEVGLTWLLWSFPDPAARGYTDWPSPVVLPLGVSWGGKEAVKKGNESQGGCLA